MIVTLLGAACACAPALLRWRAETALSDRTGCVSRVGSAWPGPTVTLEDVVLECDFGRAGISRVEIDWRWSGEVSRVSVVGGAVHLTGRPHGPVHARVRAIESSTGQQPPLNLRIEDLRLELVGPDGVEIARTTMDAEFGPHLIRATARDLITNDALSPSVSATEVGVVFDRDSRTLEELIAERPVVTAGERPSLHQALREWVRRPAASGGAGSGGSGRPTEPPFWDLVREGGAVRVTDGAVQDEEGVALSSLELELRRVSGSTFHTIGHGQPRGAGDLSWDVQLDVDTADLDGPVTLRDVPLSVFLPMLPPLPLHDPSRALVSADLRVRTEIGQVVAGAGRIQVEGLAVGSARIASAPVLGIAFEIEGSGRWLRADHAVELDRTTLRMGAAQATLSGRVMAHGERYGVDIRAELPSTPCDDAVHAIPAGLLQELQQIHLEGRLAASVVARVDSEHLADTVLRVSVDDRCRFTSVPPMADVVRFQGPFHHEVLEPDGTLFSMETGPGTGSWTPLGEISPFLIHSVLAHEDASFFTHAGFAPWAIRDALVRNLRERRYVLGASTVTMQLVKNVFLRREKTLARKIQEVLLTWWVESAMTKAQILELYLNVIEYGPAVYGIRQAAAHYFGRSPAELSVAESAYLAMILPNPPSFHEYYEAGEVPLSFRRRTAGFIGTMEHRGRIDAEAAAQGREEIEVLSFSRAGERVGPELLRGGSAQLPIEGFSGFPFASWSGPESELDERSDPDEGEATDEGWEEVWP